MSARTYNIEITLDCVDEDHDGYCSGAGAEFTEETTRTINVTMSENQLIIDDDGEIDLDQFSHLNTTTQGCTDIERPNPQKWSPSGYCDCESTCRVVSARIIPAQ